MAEPGLRRAGGAYVGTYTRALAARRLGKLVRTPWWVCASPPNTSDLDLVLVLVNGSGKRGAEGLFLP